MRPSVRPFYTPLFSVDVCAEIPQAFFPPSPQSGQENVLEKSKKGGEETLRVELLPIVCHSPTRILKMFIHELLTKKPFPFSFRLGESCPSVRIRPRPQ